MAVRSHQKLPNELHNKRRDVIGEIRRAMGGWTAKGRGARSFQSPLMYSALLGGITMNLNSVQEPTYVKCIL
jgi:hypothetical protein